MTAAPNDNSIVVKENYKDDNKDENTNCNDDSLWWVVKHQEVELISNTPIE